jgi:hypothetical protein
VIVSKPNATKTAWVVTANYIGSGQQNGYTLTAHALCAPTS